MLSVVRWRCEQLSFEQPICGSQNHLLQPNGWYWVPSSLDTETQTRSYATTAFYLPNTGRRNFFVLTNAHVHRVLTEPDANGKLIAVGVEFGHGERIHTVKAAKEVILCAG